MSRARANPESARGGRVLVGILVSLAAFVLSLLAAECIFRSFEERLGIDARWLRNMRKYVCAGDPGGFTAHPHTVYRRRPGQRGINSEGFRDEEWKLERTPGVPRILCIGGSTTAGGNPMGALGSYPGLLKQILEERLGRPVEVMNAGMSGWTSAEMVAAWFLNLQDYRPDLVVIHEAVNDVEPRNYPGFRRDYSHHRRSWSLPTFGPLSRLLAAKSDLYLWFVGGRSIPTIHDATIQRLKGSMSFDGTAFPRETIAPYRRNLRSIGRSVRDLGGMVAFMTLLYDPTFDEEPEKKASYRVGVLDNNQVMRELAAEEGWLLCDLYADEQPRREEWKPVFTDMVHVVPEGNRRKAERLAQTLLDHGWPDLPSSTGSSIGAPSTDPER